MIRSPVLPAQQAPLDTPPARRGSTPPETDPVLPKLVSVLTAHLVVALIALVVIGGATRVMEAGLACPDWPLCYGTLLPGRQMNLQVFLEWFHRLDAFVVGVALLVLGAISLLARGSLPRWLPWWAAAAVLLVAVQGALGALTVLRLLEASTVTAHLLTALSLVALLSAIHQGLEQSRRHDIPPLPRWWLPLPWLACIAMLSQSALGGTMASRWSAERCLAAGEGCRWLFLHRLGAWPATLTLLLLAMGSLLLARHHRPLRLYAGSALLLVLVQVVLGISTLRHQLSLPALTVAHQLNAALLIGLIGAVLGQSLSHLPSTTTPNPPQPSPHG